MTSVDNINIRLLQSLSDLNKMDPDSMEAEDMLEKIKCLKDTRDSFFEYKIKMSGA